MKKNLYTMMMTAVLALTLTVTCFAASVIPAEAAGRLNYTVSMEPSGSGQLYWNYGKNMEFFVLDGETFNQSCRISGSAKYQFSSLTNRGFIALPSENWYFDGVYDRSGRKLPLDTTNMDIVRMKVKGICFYDCIPSYDNPEYSRLTEKAYKELMKTGLKSLYGTRTYKVMDQVVLYHLPKKSAVYYPSFKEMKPAEFPGEKTLSKTLDAPDFYAAGVKDFPAKYSSSSSKIIKIDKKTGLCQVKGPGTATLTIKVPATEKTQAAVHQVKVTIRPDAVTSLSAKRASDQKSVSVKWKGDSRYSGYQIEVSPYRDFHKLTAKKTASSGKTASTRVTASKSAVCKYVRIRPYKTSGGRKLYGPYVSASIQ